MEIFKYLLIPIITLAIALLSLFTDTKKIKSIKDIPKNTKILFLIGLIVFSSVANIIFTVTEKTEFDRTIKQRNKNIEESNITIQFLRKKFLIFDEKLDSNFENLFKTLSDYGLKDPKKTSLDKINKIIQANKLRDEIISKTVNNNRKNIEIRYFPKDVDGEKVISALKELDFNITTGVAKIPNGQTNAIYYGSNVNEESLKLVILTLYRAGVLINGAFTFQNNKGKENQIQVVHSQKVTKNSKLEVEKLIQIK